MARPIYDEELRQLKSELVEMGDLVKQAITGSFEAVTQGSVDKAQEIASRDELVNAKERDIEARCLKLILREQPVAADLRDITAALKIITDLERIGDQSAEICEIAETLSNGVDLSKFTSLVEMAEKTQKQVSDVVDSYVNLDLDKAKTCMAGDAEINALFDQTKKDIVSHIVEHATDESYVLEVAMIAKYLERIGDHVVNIAEWVEYAITGIHKGKAIYEND